MNYSNYRIVISAALCGAAVLCSVAPAAAQSAAAPACDGLATKIVGTWGAHDANGKLQCFTYQFVTGGVLKTSSQNCSGGPSSDGSGTYSWSVNAACKLVITGGGQTEAVTITFKDDNTFAWQGQTDTYFRK